MPTHVLNAGEYWELRTVTAERATATKELERLALEAQVTLGQLQERQNSLLSKIGAAHGFAIPKDKPLRMEDATLSLILPDES